MARGLGTLVVAAAVWVGTLSNVGLGMPTITHPLEAEVVVPAASLPPPPESYCFAMPFTYRELNSRCLVSFLHSVEARVVRAIPVVQGDAKNQADGERERAVAHEVVADLIRRVGEEDKHDGKLSATFVDEILLMTDILSDRDQAFSILYHDYIARGAEALGVLAQLQTDDSSLASGSRTPPVGIPVFSPSGEVAPLMAEGAKDDEERDHLADARMAGTFAELVNPDNCADNDERLECQRAFMEKDPRFEEQERWQVRPTRAYSHQPFEKAMADLEEAKAKARASNSSSSSEGSGAHATGAPALALSGSAAVSPNDRVLVRSTSFPLRSLPKPHA